MWYDCFISKIMVPPHAPERESYCEKYHLKQQLKLFTCISEGAKVCRGDHVKCVVMLPTSNLLSASRGDDQCPPEASLRLIQNND